MHLSNSRPFAMSVLVLAAIVGTIGIAPGITRQKGHNVWPLNRALLGEYSIVSAQEYLPSDQVWRNISELDGNPYDEKLPATIRVVVQDLSNAHASYRDSLTANPSAKVVALGMFAYDYDMSKKNYMQAPFIIRYFVKGQKFEDVPGFWGGAIHANGDVLKPDVWWLTQGHVKQFTGTLKGGTLTLAWEYEVGRKYKYILKHK